MQTLKTPETPLRASFHCMFHSYILNSCYVLHLIDFRNPLTMMTTQLIRQRLLKSFTNANRQVWFLDSFLTELCAVCGFVQDPNWGHLVIVVKNLGHATQARLVIKIIILTKEAKLFYLLMNNGYINWSKLNLGSNKTFLLVYCLLFVLEIFRCNFIMLLTI